MANCNLQEAICRALGASVEQDWLTGPAGRQDGEIVPRRILLAEDGMVNQQVACRLLEVRGHSVAVANNGIEAVAALEREPFDLVLMDVQMPHMDGYEATAAIRQREKKTLTHIPIIAMTANAMKGDRERCLAAGMDAYLSKPIHAHALYEAVEGITPTTPRIPAMPVPQRAPVEVVLDWAAAVDRIGGRTDLLRQMVNLFFKECGKLLPEIRAAIDQKDAPKLRRVAHSLKGSVDCFAAQASVTAALRLELMGQEGNLSGADEAFAVLAKEIRSEEH